MHTDHHMCTLNIICVHWWTIICVHWWTIMCTLVDHHMCTLVDHHMCTLTIICVHWWTIMCTLVDHHMCTLVDHHMCALVDHHMWDHHSYISLCMSHPSPYFFCITCLSSSFQSEEQDTVVTQLHYTEWPENGRPPNSASMVELMDTLTRTQISTGNKPIVVHCKYVLSFPHHASTF